MPPFALTLAYWLHMAATVVWIGGLTFQSFILAPILEPRRTSSSAFAGDFEPLAWLSLAILIATGLTQMSANPNYTGFLSISNRWSAAILIKHVVIGLMVALAAAQTWWLQPRLARLLLVAARASSEPAEVAAAPAPAAALAPTPGPPVARRPRIDGGGAQRLRRLLGRSTMSLPAAGRSPTGPF